MHCLLKALVIFILIVLIWRMSQENMTKIRRGVGFVNDADEIPVAAGVIHSAPILDYTYSYNDGAYLASCDECPNKFVCPGCPQFKSNSAGHPKQKNTDTGADQKLSLTEYFRIRGGGESPREMILDSGYEHEEHFTPLSQSAPSCGSPDPDYKSTRMIVGLTRPGRCETRHADDFDPTDMSEKSQVSIMYADVLGIEYPPPAEPECEYFGYNGYLYKEPCKLKNYRN